MNGQDHRDHPPGEHARVTFEGTGYVIGCTPELWPLLHLPAAHTWAKSVRWSCGRPGFEAAFGPISMPREHGRPEVMLQMRAWALAGLSVTPPQADLRITSAT